MEALDLEAVIGAWALCYVTGYGAGFIARWFLGIAEKI